MTRTIRAVYDHYTCPYEGTEEAVLIGFDITENEHTFGVRAEVFECIDFDGTFIRPTRYFYTGTCARRPDTHPRTLMHLLVRRGFN